MAGGRLLCVEWAKGQYFVLVRDAPLIGRPRARAQAVPLCGEWSARYERSLNGPLRCNEVRICFLKCFALGVCTTRAV